MYSLTKFLAIAAMFSFVVACSSSNNEQDNGLNEVPSGEQLMERSSERSQKINMDKFGSLARFSADMEKLNLENLDVIDIEAKERTEAANEDVQTMVTIFNTFMTAEKTEESMNLTFEMSDEPVDAGMFLFSINADEDQQLSFQMYDEEGFEIAANNEFAVKKGTNYKGLNVRQMNEGTYLFRLKNQAGGELVRKVVIEDAE